MNVKELYILIEEYYGYKVDMISIDSEKKEVAAILYDSFLLKCSLDDRYGRFGAGIVVGKEGVIRKFLGKECSMNSDEESIKNSLKIIDDYCRMRLPDKYLEAYHKAYVEDLYVDREKCRK